MPSLRIEPAAENDVPIVLSLIKALAAYERLADKVVATEESVRESLFGRSRAAEAVIARIDTEPVGFAVWFYSYSTFLGCQGLYLEDLFVMPEWRGQGIGRALLAHLARIAQARRCGRMEWSVLNWNAPAIGFYESLGAKPMKEWTVFRLTGEPLAKLAGH